MLGLSLARAGAVALGDKPAAIRWEIIERHGITVVSHIGWIDGGAYSARTWARYAADHDGNYIEYAAPYADRAIAMEPSPFATGVQS
jgi:hypothetical protein